MIALLLNPLVLCVLAYLVARTSADIEFGKMFFIALAVAIVDALLGWPSGGGYLALVTLLPVLGLLVFLLMKHCAMALYQIGFALVLQLAFGS